MADTCCGGQPGDKGHCEQGDTQNDDETHSKQREPAPGLHGQSSQWGASLK